MRLIDNILLFPYSLFLRTRHFLYDRGLKKVRRTEVPSICVGNITVGGTGKTPHTEMLVRRLSEMPEWAGKKIAVLSRGYMRKSKGFLEVTPEGSAKRFGDEPLQIKKKFPEVTVAVDKDRVNGCRILAEAGTDLIILEDAFQYRNLDATVKIVLVDYNRPVFKDNLLPVGRLRDLPERMSKADIVIVTKCPSYLKKEEADLFRSQLDFDGPVFFTTMYYDGYRPVFPEGDPRYAHSKRLILFTGIANDEPLYNYLSLKFRLVKHFEFGDHHRYVPGDVAMIRRSAEWFATAVVMTTEKDAQRILDCKDVPKMIRERLFYVPMYPSFLNPEGETLFKATLHDLLTKHGASPGPVDTPPANTQTADTQTADAPDTDTQTETDKK